MNKKLFLLSALALITPSLLAQDLVVRNAARKWDGAFDAVINGATIRRAAGVDSTITAATLNDVMVNVTANAADVVAFVKAEGYDADLVTDKCFTAHIPASFIPTLAEQDGVVYIGRSVQYYPLLTNVRSLTNVDKVHAGTDLDTPFDGTGVVVGVIDQGFQYNHEAFRGHSSYYTSAGSFSSTLPSSSDEYATSAHGHATHVANIAAGAKVNDSGVAGNLYGIAYNAELLMCSSSFGSTDVLRKAQAVKAYAEAAGKPWVINMSFGGHQGPHDGSSQSDQNMNALMGEGGIMVAAAGNEGADKIHVMAEFDEPDQVKSLYIKPGTTGNTSKFFVLDLWGINGNNKKSMKFQPVLKTSAKEYIPTSAQLRQAGIEVDEEINALNGKQHYAMNGSISQLASVLGVTGTYYFVIKVTGNTGDGYHAWLAATTQYPSEFGLPLTSIRDYNVQRPTQDYLVGDGAANIPDAVAVGAYYASRTYKSLAGRTYSLTGAVKGAMADFSSPGPSANPNVKKPAVSAPGAVVMSAYNRFDTNVSDAAVDVVAKVHNNGDNKDDYYGLMSGTSQASPIVAGTVALWLQANPKLTPAQVLEIIKETSIRDSQTDAEGETDEDGWNTKSGYGKIDAYEGLKKALQLANNTGISQALNTETPVSLQKNDNNWKVLFNNDETYADIQIVSANGQVVARKHVASPRRGDETVLSLSSLTPGVYIFHVNTTASHITRKLVVK